MEWSGHSTANLKRATALPYRPLLRGQADAQKILAKKNLRVFQEMVSESGSPDVNIASDIAKGFNLMGDIPSGSIYPEKQMHATLLPDEVREMAGLTAGLQYGSLRREL